MAEVRCTKCGKSNPSGLAKCKFCQAPLGDSASPGADMIFGGSSSEEEAPDWLRGLRGEGEKTGSDEKESLPDWFQDESAGPKDESISRWFQDESEEFEAEIREPEGTSPDWLSRLGDTAEAEPEPAQDVSTSPPQEDFGDWLSRTQSPEPAAPEASQDDDWLTRVRARAQADQQQEAPAFDFDASVFEGSKPGEAQEAPPAEAGAVPDWLSQLAAEKPSIEEPQGTQDWASAQETQKISPFTTSPAGTDTTLPDWLSGAVSAPAAPEEPAKDEFSSWFSQDQSPAFTSPAVELPETTPDWLSALSKSSFEGAAPFEETSEATQAQASPFGSQQEMPDWLSQLSAAPAQERPSAFEPKPPDQAPAFSDEGMADQVQAEPAPAPAEGMDYLSTEPDWLSNVSKEEGSPAAAFTSEAGREEGLAPATLPDWLEAMRPVEAAAAGVPFRDISDDRMENAGPLAGLRGALPTDVSASQMRKPITYALKIQVPQEHQPRIVMLKELIADEGKARSLPTQPAISPHSVLRLIIFGAFILAIIWALSATTRQTPLPAFADAPDEVVNLWRQVDALQPGSPVLAALDYDLAFAGEMDAATGAVLDHLARKGAYISWVSTNPNGPVSAERLVEKINRLPGRGQTPFTTYINLGFIPGGAAGILGFAQQPNKMIPLDLDGNDPWISALSAEKGLESFRLILVATENPDTARSWIEQAGPLLAGKNIPLVMIISAQAEPMIRPYYQAHPRQIAGLVTGLVDGSIYENINGGSSLGGVYLDAYSIATIMAVILIVVGILLSMIPIPWVTASPKQNKSEGKA